MTKRIVDVKKFWEKNPLFTGESKYELGSSDFFNEHNRVYVNDCFAGKIDKRILPKTGNNSLILDAGCGVGFWTEFFLKNNFKLENVETRVLNGETSDVSVLSLKLSD